MDDKPDGKSWESERERVRERERQRARERQRGNERVGKCKGCKHSLSVKNSKCNALKKMQGPTTIRDCIC